MTKYHSIRPALDRGAFITFMLGARGTHKSFPALVRAMARRVRQGETTLWCRRTREEVDQWLDTFGSPKWAKVAQVAGVDLDRFRRKSNRIEYNQGRFLVPDWKQFILAKGLCEWSTVRDCDSPKMRSLILDEAFATPEKIGRYSGDEVHDFLDLLSSLHREGENHVRALLMGNDEGMANLYFDYFGIDRPRSYGIHLLTPKNAEYGRVCVELIPPREKRSQLGALVANTAYGRFLAGDPKGAQKDIVRKVPAGAWPYASVNFGHPLGIWATPDAIYFSRNVPRQLPILVRSPGGHGTRMVDARERAKLSVLHARVKRGEIYADSLSTLQHALSALKWL